MKPQNKVKTRNIYFTIKSSEDALNYKEIFDLDNPDCAQQAMEMAQFFQQAIEPVGDDEIMFNVQKALDLIKSNPDMALIKYVDTELSQKNDSVQVMVDKVVALIKDVLGVALSIEEEQALFSIIESAFVELNVEKDDAWVFWSKEEAHATAYQYNIMFAVQNEQTGFFLYGLPMGLTIHVDVDKETVLFITLEDTESYSVRVQALSVVEFLDTEIQRRVFSLSRNK